MKFEWDHGKEKSNSEKHGVTFKEASKLFTNSSEYLEIYDEFHSDNEDRFMAIGIIAKGVIVVVFVEKEFDIIRIISARKANKSEISLFNEFKQGDLL